MDGTRIDKWLWAARFFKTRALASRACDLGRIQSNGIAAKPSREVRTGDRLSIQNEGGLFVVDVKALSAMRGPAEQARALYEETAESREARQKLAQQKKELDLISPLPDRRPTKRDRRRIIQFRGRG